MSHLSRVFLTFAARDANARSLLLGATKAARLPVRFLEMPNWIASLEQRAALAAAKLQQCDLAIVLLSPHSVQSPTIAADVDVIRKMHVPLHGIRLAVGNRDEAIAAPPDWPLDALHAWNWPRLAAFLQRPQLRFDVALQAS